MTNSKAAALAKWGKEFDRLMGDAQIQRDDDRRTDEQIQALIDASDAGVDVSKVIDEAKQAYKFMKKAVGPRELAKIDVLSEVDAAVKALRAATEKKKRAGK